MAAPGEWFPAQFAQGILQLAQSKRQADAQLSEMRNQRAAANFMEKERLELANRQQAQSEAHQQAQADISLERARADIKREERETAATFGRTMSEFGRTGFAFVPAEFADKIPSLTGGEGKPNEDGITAPRPEGGAASQFATIEMPGFGTILQRIGGPGFEKQAAELDKIHAQTEKYRQDSALSAKRTETAAFAAEEKRKRIESMEGRLSLEHLRLANNRLDSLRKQAQTQVSILTGSANKADRERGRMAADDLSLAFKEGSPERDTWKALSEIVSSGLSAQQKNIPPAKNSDPEQIDALGLREVLYGDPPGPGPAGPAPAAGVKIVGRIRDETGQTFLIDERGQKIPVAPSEGTAPGGHYTPPAAPSSAQTASPEDVAEYNDLARQYQAAPRGSPAREALRKQLLELKLRRESR